MLFRSAFEKSNVGAVNSSGAADVIGGNGAVQNVTVGDGMFENGIQ